MGPAIHSVTGPTWGIADLLQIAGIMGVLACVVLVVVLLGRATRHDVRRDLHRLHAWRAKRPGVVDDDEDRVTIDRLWRPLGGGPAGGDGSA